MTAKLSKDAEKILIDTTGRQGATIPAGMPAEVVYELAAQGLIGGNGGITRRGLIQREQILEQRLNEAF